MKRRSFLQSVIGGVTALFAAEPAWPTTIPEVFKQEKPVWRRNEVLEPSTEHDKILTAKKIMDFFPEEIVSLESFEGRCLVFCKHSIWEIETNCYGDYLQRKLLKYS